MGWWGQVLSTENVRDRVEPDVSLALEYGGSIPPGLPGSFSSARTNSSTTGHSLLEIITKGAHWQVLSLSFFLFGFGAQLEVLRDHSDL